MAYLYGVPRQDPRRQAAEDLRMQLGLLRRTVKSLAPAEGQQYMTAFIDGLLEVAGSPARKSSGRGPARKDRVAKKKAKANCLGCGARMKPSDAACRKCARPSPVAETRKAMLAGGVRFVGKAMRPRCPRCGNVSRPDARCCTGCGRALLQVVKSAAQADADQWMARYRREADPAQREVFWRLAHPDLYPKGGTAS